MTVAEVSDLLYPLSLFCQNGGHPLPSYAAIDGADMPEPYRGLLVHHGDMTSRLAAYFGGDIVIEVLHCEHTVEAYRREVVLHIEGTGLPVEYGAIEIDLGAFDDELQRLILEQHLPLGGLLNRFGMQYRSEPRGFIRLGPDAIMQKVFGMPDAEEFYGRCNVLLGEDGRTLARIVEVVRPVENLKS